MRKIELDSRAFIASEGKMNFIALGSEKTSDPEFVREFIIPKIHKETTHHDKGFWGTLGLSDDEKIEWKGYLEVSREGNQVDSQEGVVSDEVSDLERCFIDLKEDEESILEHVISFEHVVIDFPESFTPEEMPSARLDVMLPRDHGAIAFYQSHRDSKDEETAIEYILPKATAGNNTNERDRLTYHFDLIPQRRAKEIEGAPGFYRLESEEKRTPFIVKVITFRRSWEDTSKMRFQRETSKEIIERVTKTLGAGDIRNTLAVDHKLLVFSQDRNDFIEAEKGHVRADLKTLFLIHGTFGSTRSSFGKLYGSDSSWLKSLIDRGLYGQILAYDHPTVFFGAEENIALLLRKLGKLIDTPFAHDMDFIGTSQGGLLVQYLANLSDKGILNVGRAALVASANGVQYFTVGKYVSKFLTALKFILKLASRPGGALAASLAQHSADFLLKQPGFRIMTPGDEKLLQIINVPPVYERTLYLPLVDDYDESIIDDRDWRKLKKRIMKFGAGVVDNITGRILGEENDWVVGTRNQYMVPADYCAIPDYNPAKFRDKMIPAIHGSCIYHDDARILIEDFLSGRAVTSGKVRTDLFDAHCHLFGRDIITARIVLLLIEELVNYREIKDRTDDLIELPDITGNGLSPSQVNPGSVAGNVIRYFLLNRDSDHMLRDLEDEYYKLNSEVYKYIALMFDLEMTFRNSYRTANDDQSLEEMQEDFRKRLAGYRKDISELIGEFNQGGKKIFKGSAEDNEKGVEILKTIRSSLKVLKPENLDLVGDTRTAYERQLRELKGLKVRYGKSLYPFLAVDPRREGMGKLIKENVGKENAFRGIKLYPPNGYSPTDPHLFEKGNDFVEGQCLYEYCLNKNIPIMVHCSFEGFSTFVMNLEVWGDVYLYDKPTGEYILTTYNQPEEITFESNIFKGGFKKSVRERAHVLNHPCIWKKVLEEFPDLKICLAHFGGESDEWRNRIADLMREYSHVYTDLSCTVDKKVLEKIRDQYFSPSAPDPINDRIMYGSDYVLNMLSVKSFGDYYNHFYKASLFTGQQRENMMLHVPERFLS